MNLIINKISNQSAMKKFGFPKNAQRQSIPEMSSLSSNPINHSSVNANLALACLTNNKKAYAPTFCGKASLLLKAKSEAKNFLEEATTTQGEKLLEDHEIKGMLENWTIGHGKRLDSLLEETDSEGDERFHDSEIVDIMKHYKPEHNEILDSLLQYRKSEGNERFNGHEIADILSVHKPEHNQRLDTLLQYRKSKEALSSIDIAKFLKNWKSEDAPVFNRVLGSKNPEGENHFSLNNVESLLWEFKKNNSGLEANEEKQTEFMQDALKKKTLANTVESLWLKKRESNLEHAQKRFNELNLETNPLQYAPSKEAIEQTDRLFKTENLAPDEKIVDGLMTYAYCGDKEKGEKTIIDLKNDKTLKKTIGEMKDLFAEKKNLSEEQKITTIMRKVASTFSKVDSFHYALPTDDPYYEFMDLSWNKFDKKNVLLGSKMDVGAGVCRDRALLVKVIADATGLKVGLHSGKKPAEAHVWNTFVNSKGETFFADAMQSPDELLPFEEHREYYSTYK